MEKLVRKRRARADLLNMLQDLSELGYIRLFDAALIECKGEIVYEFLVT